MILSKKVTTISIANIMVRILIQKIRPSTWWSNVYPCCNYTGSNRTSTYVSFPFRSSICCFSALLFDSIGFRSSTIVCNSPFFSVNSPFFSVNSFTCFSNRSISYFKLLISAFRELRGLFDMLLLLFLSSSETDLPGSPTERRFEFLGFGTGFWTDRVLVIVSHMSYSLPRLDPGCKMKKKQ